MRLAQIARLLRDDRGFTLQETVVVMIVSSLLVGFSYVLFQFVMQFIHTNLVVREHRETLRHVAAVICTDIECSRLAEVSGSALILERSAGSSVQYSVAGGQVIRNQVVITPPDSSLWSVKWRETSDSTGADMRAVAMTLRVRWKGGVDSVEVSARVPWSSKGAFALGRERMKL